MSIEKAREAGHNPNAVLWTIGNDEEDGSISLVLCRFDETGLLSTDIIGSFSVNEGDPYHEIKPGNVLLVEVSEDNMSSIDIEWLVLNEGAAKDLSYSNMQELVYEAKQMFSF